MDADETLRTLDARGLDPHGECEEHQQVREADEGVEDEERPVGVPAVEPQREEQADRPGEERAGRLGKARNGRVDREEPSALLGRRGLRQHRLLDGEEHADLGRGGADRSGEGADEQQPEVAREREEQPTGDHQGGHRLHRAPPSVPVGDQRPGGRHDRRAGNRGGEHEADLDLGEAKLVQVQR